jgi:hypothetical protein
MDLDSNVYFKLCSSDYDETYERVGKTLALLEHKHNNKTLEMWYSHICDPFKIILEVKEYPRIFSKNGYVQNFMTLVVVLGGFFLLE